VFFIEKDENFVICVFPMCSEKGVFMQEIHIGKVTHYFTHLSVAAINLTGELKVGDTVRFKGHTSDFSEKVEGIQIEHMQVLSAKAGDKIGVKTVQHAREHDDVYKVVG
jgi:putative protease